jgi:hypothetical protein
MDSILPHYFISSTATFEQQSFLPAKASFLQVKPYSAFQNLLFRNMPQKSEYLFIGFPVKEK